MTVSIYFSIALIVYLVFVYLEVTYCDLLEARREPILSHEAMAVMAASLIWPVTLTLLAAVAALGLGFNLFLLTKSLWPGRFHQWIGFVIYKCSKGISSICRRTIKKCKEYKNARTSGGTEEVPGQNQEGIEANIGGAAQI